MDIETSEAIETLRGDLRHVEAALGGRIDAVGARIIRIIAEGFIALNGKVDALNAKVDRLLPPDALH